MGTNRSTSTASIRRTTSGDLRTVKGEATDVDQLAAAMEGCDAVVHLAAMADVNHVQADPIGAELLNSRATIAVLEAARRSGVGRVVYGSTIWVYSDSPETEVDEDTRPGAPSHLYTSTKLAGEHYCHSYAELYGLDYTILRFGIPYGPRARDATVLAAFTKKALAGDPLTVAGSGDQTRRFVYVEDLADGIERALRPEAANRVYNLAGNEDTTILQIAQAVQELVGDVEIVHTEARAGDFGGKEVSNSRALAELGWEPATPFSEGARRYVAWRREQPAAPAAAPAGAARETAGGRLRERLAALGARLELPRMRPVLSAVAVTGGLVWSFASDDGLAFFQHVFPSTRPVTAVSTTRPEVGLIVDAPAAMAADVAAEVRRSGATASIALTSAADRRTLAQVHGQGSDVLPRLKPGGPVRWIGTRGQLHGTAKRLGLSGHYYYAVPGKGFTLGQDLLGSTAGGSPVAGDVKVTGMAVLGKLERGDLVELSVGPKEDWRSEIDSLAAQLHARGLHAVTAASLVRSDRHRR